MLIAIIGRSASGKSSVIEELKKRGHKVIPEVARDVLVARSKNPTDYKEISIRQELITQRRLLLESDIKEDEVVFTDRGIFDEMVFREYYLGYFPLCEFIASNDLIGRYDLVFCLDPLPFKHDGIRVERSEEEASEIQKRIELLYKIFGHNIYHIPVESVDNRVNLIEDISERYIKETYQ